MPAPAFDLHLRTSLSFVNARDVGRLTAPSRTRGRTGQASPPTSRPCT